MISNKIKVLIITPFFPTKYDLLAGTFFINQIQELKKYCEIKVLFPYPYVPKIKFLNPYYRFSKIKGKDVFKGIEVFYPKYFQFPRVLFVPRFLHFFLTIEAFISYLTSKNFIDNMFKDWDPDIIHLHGTLGAGLIGIRIKRKYNKPILITLHGEDMTKYAHKAFSKKLTKFTLRNVDAINSQSIFMKNEVLQLGIKNKKIYLIPMGANIEKFKLRDKIQTRKLLNLPKNKKIILFIGHLIERKAPNCLIKAIKHISKDRNDILCCLIGKGHMENNLKKMVSELNLEDNITFLGHKPNNEVALYLNACDVFVLPSLSEGLAVAPCEALACGKPVVVTRVGALPEIVTKDVGYLVKPKNDIDLADKISKAIDRKWNTNKILERSKLFSVPSSAKNLVELYKNLSILSYKHKT